jgi:protein SCO1/2
VSRASAIVTAVLILAGVAGWQSLRATAAAPLPVLYNLGGDFTLPSTLGRAVSLADFHGEVVLLNFGYTSCPDVCPTALARIRDVLHALPEAPLQPVFVTLDPERDTLGRLAPYVGAFDARFVAVTGSAAEISDAAARYHVYSEKRMVDSPLGYSIDHSGQIYLLDGDGRVRATFGESVTVPAMVTTVRQLLAETL